MTRSSQTEYERVAGVLEACADAEKRLGGHPYRAKIMRRSAELLRRADVLLRTPAEARQVLALDAIRDVLGIDYDEDSAMWYLPAEPAPIECATLDDALRAYAKMAAPVSGEPSGAEAVVREAWRSVTDSLPKPGADVIAGYRDTAGRWLSVRSVYAAARSVACTCERDGDCLCEMDDTGESWWPEGWYEVAENCDDDANAWRIGGTVTHWMPLPTPPGEEEGESDAE